MKTKEFLPLLALQTNPIPFQPNGFPWFSYHLKIEQKTITCVQPKARQLVFQNLTLEALPLDPDSSRRSRQVQ